MIRHAGLFLPIPVGTLAVAMIESAFLALLVAPVSAAALLSPGALTARQAAIALATITVEAQPEDGAAGGPAANPLPENYFCAVVHLPGRAGLDTDSLFVSR